MQVALFSVVWGITVMHRFCGVYDLCFCHGLCAHVLLQSVCGDGGATRVRDRGERYAWTEPSVRTTLLLLALTNTVLGGWHPHIVVVVLVHVVCIEYCAVTLCG
ncbi:retrotransposon hot spot (RHS) protein [Trypanosoma cruzi]|nr:retrotransposon hot spot (RHS) protein [Trypanosoma cruzi]